LATGLPVVVDMLCPRNVMSSVLMGRSGVLCFCILTGALFLSSCPGRKPTPRARARAHITALKGGDFSHDGAPLKHLGTPSHIWKLIEIGPPAADELIPLLHDNALTPFVYREALSFRGGLVHDLQPRTATLGDVADFVLRSIYRSDVGYRSYHPKMERDAAIERWRKVVVREKKRSKSGE